MRRRSLFTLLTVWLSCAQAADLMLPARIPPSGGLAELAMARRQFANFNRPQALQHLSAAFTQAPDNPDVLIDYAAATPDPVLESALLRRLLNSDATSEARHDAERRLGVLSRLGDRPTHQLASPYIPHTIRIPVAYSRTSHAAGWVLVVRFNEGRPLRLLLDTGARGILISAHLARKLQLEYLGVTVLGGFGEEGNLPGEYRLANDLRIGDLHLRNVVVETGACELPAELDGLAGVDLFRHFAITLDGPRGLLLLTPFAADPRAGDGERPWPDVAGPGGGTLERAGHLLIAHAETRDGASGRFVLDSGAAYSLLHPREPAIALRKVSLQGLSGFAQAEEVMQPVPLRIGGLRTMLREAVATDLSPVSARLGIRIDGFLGFPLLRRLVTTIDLREGRLELR